jgi:Patatin-like phospholipase
MKIEKLSRSRSISFLHATPSERISSIKLIEIILDTIADSVSTFRPSKSLAYISQQQDEETKVESSEVIDSGSETDSTGSKNSLMASIESPPSVAEIDLVISGGGFKGYFMCGAAHVLMKELAKRNMRINRIAGTSAGAWAGLFICCGFNASHWLKTYYACKDRPNGTIHEVYTELVRVSRNHYLEGT